MEKKAIKAILIKEKKLWVQILVCRFFTKAHLVAGSDTDSTKVPWVGKRMRGFEPSVYNTAGCLWIQGMARLWITMLCRFLSTYSATYFPSLNFTSGKAQRCFRDSWLFFFFLSGLDCVVQDRSLWHTGSRCGSRAWGCMGFSGRSAQA